MLAFSDNKAPKKYNNPRTLAGIGLIILSYIAGWPVIGALGIISTWMNRPDLVLVGGPAVYILSYLILLAGIILAGKECAKMVTTKAIIFAKWLLPV
ncbi:MAG: hypothetical protein IME96_06865 [Proteobacteria bacterium]|nr:hypothetical protein [Pseudomonadota bacterium]